MVEKKKTKAATGESESKMSSEKGEIFRRDISWAVTCTAIMVMTLCVHYRALCEDRTDLSLENLMASMEAKCRSLGDVFERSANATLLHPVPTHFGVAVWVAREPWSLPVHDALDRIENALARVVFSRAGENRTRIIQRLVRVTTKTLDNTKNGDKASLAAAAAKQQLGLGVAKHAYAVDLRGELLMHGISFFRRPSSVGQSRVECFVFAERQAYCTIPDGVSAEWLSREVPAAIATLMSNWLSLDSFRDSNVVLRWVQEREAHSCHYALRALRQLERSVNAHPEMPAPEGVGEEIKRLVSLIESGMFAHFARAADDLQFHPLLLPQLHISWDQALVNHASILLPVVSLGMVGVRTIVAEIKRRRTLAKAQGTAGVKKEQ